MDNLAYKDPPKYEILNGKVTAMSPSRIPHMEVSANIYDIFRQYLKGKPCKVYFDGVTVYLTEKDHFIPDVLVLCDRSKVTRNGIHGAPDLVVEVLSQSTASRDKIYKKGVYEKSGVKEYWLVSTKEKSVEVYVLRDGVFVLDGVYTLCPEDELADLTEEEKSGIVSEFQCSIFDSLTVSLEDVFYDMLPD